MGFFSSIAASWVANKLSKIKWILPSEALHLSLSGRRWHDSYWDLVEAHGEPAMIFYSKWYFTNKSKTPIRIHSAYFKKPKAKKSKLETLSTRQPDDGEYGEYPILPEDTSEIVLILTIQPPCRKEGESIDTKVVFVDSLNRKHKAKARFVGRSDAGILIFCMKLDERAKGELEKNRLPSKVKKKLAKTGHRIAEDSEILPSRSGGEWEIKNPDMPSLIYTAKLNGTEVCLFKKDAPPQCHPMRRTSPYWQSV